MKGVVLAGGTGTRLHPMTRVTNKHLLPVYDLPMIYYPVETLVNMGISEILVISDPNHIGKYMELLEMDFDCDFQYKTQSEPKGIAHAISLAEDFVDDKFAVILGDNILFGDAIPALADLSPDTEGKVFLKEVEEPSAYGVASIEDDEIVDLTEKPTHPDSNYAIIGLYVYDDGVFDVIRQLTPSDRGEYEVTDINEIYLQEGVLDYEVFDGQWFDVGTPEGLHEASAYVSSELR